MRRAFCIALSGMTAYAVAGFVAAHEGPLRCTVPGCGPDELPGMVFLLAWPALWFIADRGTRRG